MDARGASSYGVELLNIYAKLRPRLKHRLEVLRKALDLALGKNATIQRQIDESEAILTALDALEEIGWGELVNHRFGPAVARYLELTEVKGK